MTGSRRGVEFANVSLAYDEGAALAVEDISLKIEPGEFVAIVGPSGCGKSTFMKLATGLKAPTRGRVFVDGNPVKLTSHEYRLLAYLMHHQGRVVSRSELVEHLYDQDFDRDSNTIEVFVTRIRKKLGADVITTIRGLGYSLEDPQP